MDFGVLLMSFTRKIIATTFTLAQGTFDGTSSNALNVSGLRCRFRLEQQGGVSGDKMSLDIYGLTKSQANQLSTYGAPPLTVGGNQITVSAGDNETGLTKIFDGVIQQANADFSGMPDVCLRLRAFSNYFASVGPSAPLSFSGVTPVATIMAQLAAAFNPVALTLENAGVEGNLIGQYLCGSAWDQIKTVARAAGINAYADTVRGVLAIFPKTGSRAGTPILISPSNGLVGYPTFGTYQLNFRTLFNPGLVYARAVTIQSSLPNASQTVTPWVIKTSLDTEISNGLWFQDVISFSNNRLYANQ